MIDPKGDGSAFDANWRNRVETGYLHWTRKEPENQIQLAFRQHWLTFNRLLVGLNRQRRCLEVGCGRGSLSAYFADDGWDCTLLDLSEVAISRAREAFSEAGLTARFDIGNCLALPYKNDSFDLVFSIGLLEHFEDIDHLIAEQTRVLAPGGMFIGYVVPHLPECTQKDYEWINELLRALLCKEAKEATLGKTEVYRSDVLSPDYLKAMQKAGLGECQADGIYPLPMISHSPSFPFSLLPPAAEKSLVSTFQKWLDQRESETSTDPWRCPEGEGQAFIVWGKKL
jgi:ubiquinone/menaquinone biosynthesis C-methylase UbiE